MPLVLESGFKNPNGGNAVYLIHRAIRNKAGQSGF